VTSCPQDRSLRPSPLVWAVGALAALLLVLGPGAGFAQATDGWSPVGPDDPAYEYWQEFEDQLGDFSQFNDEEADADSNNANRTVQLTATFQVADCLMNCTNQTLDQTSTNTNATGQDATATATATQVGARNYVMTRTLVGGVVQSNTVDSVAAATNGNETIQRTFQIQVGCLAFCTVGVLGQSSTNTNATTQAAVADADATQVDPRNEFVGEGGSGTVSQTNAVTVDVVAANTNTTKQRTFQIQIGCRKSCFDIQMIQTAVNQALTSQTAEADGSGVQVDALNVIDIDGGALGGVEQANTVTVTVTATNDNTTKQRNRQWQFGCKEDCHFTSAVQTATNTNGTTQTSDADAEATQVNPRNEFDGEVIVGGYGSQATQVNSVVTTTKAENTNTTVQENDSLQDAITTDEVEVPEVPASVEEEGTMGEE